jgi:hypothetical protein
MLVMGEKGGVMPPFLFVVPSFPRKRESSGLIKYSRSGQNRLLSGVAGIY